MLNVTLEVNGEKKSVEVRDPAEPLLYVLRNALALTGAKFGCGLGQCGACTVIVDGDAVRSCTLPVAQAAGKKVITIEGLGTAEKPHPLQMAFVAEQAAQCGYCVPGMVMSGAALLARKPAFTREAVARLAGPVVRDRGRSQRQGDDMVGVAGHASLPRDDRKRARIAGGIRARDRSASLSPHRPLQSAPRASRPRWARRSTAARSMGSSPSTPTIR